MKYCQKCGKQILDEAVICPGCGCQIENAATTDPADASNFGMAVLGFLLPVVGLILYLVWKDKSPLKAKSAGKGALVSVILSFAVSLIVSIFFGNILMEFLY